MINRDRFSLGRVSLWFSRRAWFVGAYRRPDGTAFAWCLGPLQVTA